jgi:hypothetical protein
MNSKLAVFFNSRNVFAPCTKFSDSSLANAFLKTIFFILRIVIASLPQIEHPKPYENPHENAKMFVQLRRFLARAIFLQSFLCE